MASCDEEQLSSESAAGAGVQPAEKSLDLVETAVDKIPDIVSRVRAGYRSHIGWSNEEHKRYRLHQLQQFKMMLEENEKMICDALWTDLHKAYSEAVIGEYHMVYSELIIALRDLDQWTKPHPVDKDLVNKLSTVHLQPEPYGTVLVISPWNYPVQLALIPLLGAIAAGNAVVLKPSEMAVATSNTLCDLISKYMGNEMCVVVPGGVEVSKALLQERFDYIFYTGSTSIGRLVMRAAAEHITPVTLELGGKSPVIVADDANIGVAARRIIWGKLMNAGQSCIAPDYVVCSASIRDRLVHDMKAAIVEFYGSEDPHQCSDYGRIICTRHYQRLCGVLDSCKGTNILTGGRDESQCYIAPAIIVDVSPDDPIMQDEIFGPILPIITVESVQKAIDFVNNREKPLTFYVFTENKATFELISNSTSSGAIVCNDTMQYYSLSSLPFGGVGYSGIGAYHGKHTFDTFTHLKPVYSIGTGLETVNRLRYPPFKEGNLSKLRWLTTPSSSRRSKFLWF